MNTMEFPDGNKIVRAIFAGYCPPQKTPPASPIAAAVAFEVFANASLSVQFILKMQHAVDISTEHNCQFTALSLILLRHQESILYEEWCDFLSASERLKCSTKRTLKNLYILFGGVLKKLKLLDI